MPLPGEQTTRPTAAPAPAPAAAPAPRAALLAALLCALAACTILLSSCLPEGGHSIEHAMQTHWDQDGFSLVDGRYTHTTQDGAVAAKTGVDVSEHQGVIDWEQVAADGIQFAFIRVGYRGTTEGGLFQDAFFSENLVYAQEAGIECGAYFFSQAVDEAEAREEAELTIELLDGLALQYPVVFDHEVHAAGLDTRTSFMTRDQATAVARAYCERLEEAGYTTMLYGNQYDLARYKLEELGDRPVWYAEYGSVPTGKHHYDIWQYTHDGIVAGIDTAVDLNLDMQARS